MSFYGIAVMACLIISDYIYTYALRIDGFADIEKKGSVSYASLRLFFFIMFPYWMTSYFVGKNSFGIEAFFCFAASILCMSLEYYLQKQYGKALNCFYIPALFALSLIVLLFINGFDNDLTVKSRFVYSFSGLLLALFSVLTYSTIKSKVSAFRYGRALSILSATAASLIFGMAAGAILQTCLG
jgi:hypothetical protein